MKIVTVTGYYGTGSSAVTDLISELDNVHSLGDYEIRFLHDPDGLSDLEFKIIENFNRHNSSHAVKHYLQYAKFLNSVAGYRKYAKLFNDRFMEYTYEYLDELIEFKYCGSWHYDVIDKGMKYYILDRIVNKCISKINRWFNKKLLSTFNVLSKNEKIVYGVNPDADHFLAATRKYVRKLLMELNDDTKEFLMIDQIVASSNISRYLRYFSEPCYVFLVDRDPRDLFILDKLYWGGNGFPGDVVKFCKHYRLVRYTKKKEVSCNAVCGIQFEDMVYKYDETKRKIFGFIGTEEKHHAKPLKYLQPDISRNNTQLWIKHPEYNEEIRYIEENLPEYLYDYTDFATYKFTGNAF